MESIPPKSSDKSKEESEIPKRRGFPKRLKRITEEDDLNKKTVFIY